MNKIRMMLAGLTLIGIFAVVCFSSAFGQISNIRVSNLTSSSATITWATSDSTEACLNYGLATGALEDTACDARPDDDIHRVQITGLSARTTYYFEVVSGGVTDNNGAAYYTFTTAEVGSGDYYGIFGRVMLSDGVTPAFGTIITARVKSDGSSSSPLSALSYGNGAWSLNLGNLKNVGDGTVFSCNTGDSIFIDAQGAADGAGQSATTVSGSSPQNTGTIILTLAVNDPPVVSDIPDQSVLEGESFASVNLDEYVSDGDNSDDEMAWTYWGNVELLVGVVDRVAAISVPYPGWNGVENIWFKACDPGGLCDSNEAAFAVSPRGGVISVGLDIKPGSCPNPLNSKSKGVLPAAILGTADLDVMRIDPATLLLEGVAPVRWNFEDVSAPADPKENSCDCATNAADGYMDLTLKFDRQEILATLRPVNDGEVRLLTLTGMTYDSTDLEAKDCLIIIHKGPSKVSTETADKFDLQDSYPNPFNAETIIEYTLPEDCHVNITVYNVLGRKVRSLVSGYQLAGHETVVWDGKDDMSQEVASGVYFYAIEAGDFKQVKKMVLLK
jgi:hypothetical protein